jgi:hypothetical protein
MDNGLAGIRKAAAVASFDALVPESASEGLMETTKTFFEAIFLP